MKTGRLEAFSDGVIAIIITIMVLELKVPHDPSLEALKPLFPVFLSYILSFIYVGIYWNNHHHLLSIAEHVDGSVLWSNHFLLFWLSLIPFVTAWMGENHFQSIPTALYGVVLFMCGSAYNNLVRLLLKLHDKDSDFTESLKKTDKRGIISISLYLSGVIAAFYAPWASCVIYVTVAVMWLIPYRSIEKKMDGKA